METTESLTGYPESIRSCPDALHAWQTAYRTLSWLRSRLSRKTEIMVTPISCLCRSHYWLKPLTALSGSPRRSVAGAV